MKRTRIDRRSRLDHEAGDPLGVFDLVVRSVAATVAMTNGITREQAMAIVLAELRGSEAPQCGP